MAVSLRIACGLSAADGDRMGAPRLTDNSAIVPITSDKYSKMTTKPANPRGCCGPEWIINRWGAAMLEARASAAWDRDLHGAEPVIARGTGPGVFHQAYGLAPVRKFSLMKSTNTLSRGDRCLLDGQRMRSAPT